MMSRKALLVGIDTYDHLTPLRGCVADVQALSPLLRYHGNDDEAVNYDCRLMVSSEERVTRTSLRKMWDSLFHNCSGDILFYFAGHGVPSEVGGYLVTQDGTLEDPDPGLPMNDLLEMANNSQAREVLLILDCCSSGLVARGGKYRQVSMREGITLIASSQANEDSYEIEGHGIFTKLVIGALTGGAADLRGNISAAAIYAYVEQALGPWKQRPLYKSYASSLTPVRQYKPDVTDRELRRLIELFTTDNCQFPMDETFEPTHPAHIDKNVAIFDLFKKYRNARLLNTEDNLDLYWVAMNKVLHGQIKHVMLTPLGRSYWNLVKDGRI
jgi:Caspase domain